MNKSMKQKYVPCELNVVEFNVERGFAVSPANASYGMTGTTAIDPNQQANMMYWTMSSQQGSDGIGHYRNEQFTGDGITWFE